MKNPVTVHDDSYLLADCIHVTKELALSMASRGIDIPQGTTVVPNKVNGKIVMKPVMVEKVYEGDGLKHAITRAKRWVKNKGFNPGSGVPNHINLAMAAFKLADPQGFNLAMEGAAQ